MKSLAALAALTVAVASTVAPALARPSYVIDDAHMLSSAETTRINQKVGDFNAQTGKEVVVITTPSLQSGQTVAAAAERAFAQNQVNGVEIYIAKGDKKIEVLGDRASRQFFPSGSFQTIYQAMRASFNTGNVDAGVDTGVDLVLNTYRGHESSLNANRRRVPAASNGGYVSHSQSGGFSMGWIWWVIILAVIFFIIRGIFRAMSGPRMMPPGYGGPGYGGPGYGGGMGGGMGMGGGGFWSGLLGGLGGAWLGNEIFGGGRNNFGGDGGGYGAAGVNDPGQSQDASGWQSDAGQADTTSAGGGGWGDSSSGDSGGGWGGGDGGGGGGDGGGGDGGGW